MRGLEPPVLANLTLVGLTNKDALLPLTNIVEVRVLSVVHVGVPLLEVFFFVEHGW